MTYVDEKIVRLIQDLVTELQNEILTFIVKMDILQASVLTLLLDSVFINDLGNRKGSLLPMPPKGNYKKCMHAKDRSLRSK